MIVRSPPVPVLDSLRGRTRILSRLFAKYDVGSTS